MQVLADLIRTHGRNLDAEALRTLMVEVEAVVNSRPLATDTISDGDSKTPISPSNILTIKLDVVISPPGNFKKLICTTKKVTLSAKYHKRILVKVEKGVFGIVTIQSQVKRYIQKFSDWGMFFCYKTIKHGTNGPRTESSKRNQVNTKLSKVSN